MLARQEQELNQAEENSTLQAVAEKTSGEIGENRRKNDVDFSRTFDRIKAEGNIITDGSHIEKGKLKPNVTYQTGEHEYLYQTDGMGRICRAIAKHLKYKAPGKRKDHYRKTPGKLPGDEAGHLIADRFAGSRKKDNLVSQAKDVNHKEFGRLEDLWAAAIDEGKEVSLDIQVFYDGDGKRPVSFRVDYAIDGVVASVNIFNDNGGVINNG